MARKKLETMELEPSLDELISQYSENKTELDSYKKICEDESSNIKRIMMADSELQIDENHWEKVVGSVKASIIVSTKQSFNEDALLDVIKNCGVPGIIKTKEYVDTDALESAIYAGELSKEVLMEIDGCRETKKTPMLKLTRMKGE